MVTVEVDPVRVESRLAAGEIGCPRCGGVLGGWGHARQGRFTPRRRTFGHSFQHPPGFSVRKMDMPIKIMGNRMDHSDGTSRRVIDLAVGVLVGLRGCSPEEAFVELVEVVRQTGVGIGTIATELVALASGAKSADPGQDLGAWADLIRQRRTDPMAAAR